MTDGEPGRGDIAQALLNQLDAVQLRVSGEAALVGADETDPGTLDWFATATIPVWPDEDEPDEAWQFAEGVALSTTARHDGGLDLVVFEANGLIVNLQHVHDAFAALDARSQDYAHFLPLLGNRRPFGILELTSDLEDKLEPGGNQVVIVDRVRLAPAWRGLGGVGRLLTGRLLRWICDDPRVVVVQPFPTDLDEDARNDDAVFNPALERVRRVWASLAFEPFTENIWFMDPRLIAHSEAIADITQRLL